MFREVTLSRRFSWGTACTGALLVLLSEARRQPPLLCGRRHTAGAQIQLLVLPEAHALAAVEMSFASSV